MREERDVPPPQAAHAKAAPETRPQQEQPNTTAAAPRSVATDSPSAQAVVGGWKRLFYLSFGGIFFVLGVLGALLPGLPATPFLLLTSYFLVRSSPRLNAALLRSRLFGSILTDWQVHGGVRQAVKLKAIAVVVLAVSVTIILSGYALLPTLVVVFLAAIGITVILYLPLARRP